MTSGDKNDHKFSLVKDGDNDGGVLMTFEGGDKVNGKDNTTNASRYGFEIVLGCDKN